MGKLSLKNILTKDNENYTFVNSLIRQLDALVSIEDNNEKNILSNSEKKFAFQTPVLFENETMGVVKGNETSPIIAEALAHLLKKESEKKKLGTEVLNLYQEINLIFNFSEKLAQAIGATAISAITLDEASHVIKSESGVVVLWDEEKNQLQVTASTDQLFFDEGKINDELPLLLNIILSGQF